MTNGTAALIADMEAAGRAAYDADQPAAPALNPVVIDAIADLPVGGGAVDIMRAFTRGYDARATEAAAAILTADAGRIG